MAKVISIKYIINPLLNQLGKKQKKQDIKEKYLDQEGLKKIKLL